MVKESTEADVVLSLTQQPVSIADYLRQERAAVEKSEFFQGSISPRARSSIRHNVITGNLLSALHQQLTGAAEVFGSDLRIAIPVVKFYTYADVMVLTGEPEIDRYDRDTVTNLQVVCEVFSPETEAYDLGTKFHRYSRCPLLQEYLVISETDHHVERRIRREQGEWLLSWFDGLDDVIEIAAIKCSLPMRAIYDRVNSY